MTGSRRGRILPLLRHAVVALGGRRRAPEGQERDASYYDDVYRESAEYRKHYTASRYYFLWSVIVDRMERSRLAAAIDIGCGSGQFAALLAARGFPRYVGIDLSPTAIRAARNRCPSYSFVAGDIFTSDLPESAEYDVAVSMEFLEHVHEDLAVVRRIRPGTRFLGTVPNFPYESHVRHFRSADEVRERYGPLFRDFRVDSYAGDESGIVYHLCDGVRD